VLLSLCSYDLFSSFLSKGAFVQGIGYFLTEEIVYDPTNPGVLLTNGTWEYKPPSSTDIPIDLRLTLLKDAPNPLGVVNSKVLLTAVE